jgi:hypothetical protein
MSKQSKIKGTNLPSTGDAVKDKRLQWFEKSSGIIKKPNIDPIDLISFPKAAAKIVIAGIAKNAAKNAVKKGVTGFVKLGKKMVEKKGIVTYKHIKNLNKSSSNYTKAKANLGAGIGQTSINDPKNKK